MTNRSLPRIHLPGLILAIAACLAAAPAATAQQSPNSSTSSATNLGTLVVAPSQTPASSTKARKLRIQRRALNLNLSSGPAPISPAAPLGQPQQSRHVVQRQPPRPLRVLPPQYPAKALAERTRGTVTVAFTIEPDGSTADVHIVGSQPPGVFNNAAITAVRQWRFHPATADGVPVTSKARQTLVFRPPARQGPAVAKTPPGDNGEPVPANSVPSNIHPTHLVPPDYPTGAYRARQGGQVTVSFMVGRHGHTRDIRILASKPRHTFDSAAIEAVRQWRFEPVEAPTKVVQTITFTPPD